MIERLSPKETSILKHLLGLGKKDGEKIVFSVKSACKELKLTDVELIKILRGLSSKGFILIHRLPMSTSPVELLYNEIEEMDLQQLAGAIDEVNYQETRDKLLKELRAFKDSGGKSPVIPISINKAREIRNEVEDLINRLKKLQELQEKKRESKSATTTFEKLKGEYDEKLRRNQASLNEYLDFFWNRLSRLKFLLEDSKQKKLEMDLRYEVGEYDRDQHKRIMDEFDQQNNKILRRILVLMAGRAEALIHEIPEPLAEELQVLEARKEIGEINKDEYKVERSKLLDKVRATQAPRIEKGKLLKFKENLARLSKLLEDLKQKRMLEEETFSLVMKGLTVDMKNLEDYQIFLEEV